MKNLNLYNVIAVLWGSAIGILSLLPAQTAVASPVWDKLEHAVAFCVLAILTMIGKPSWPGLGVWLGVSLYGIAIELGQGLSPGRFPDPWDAFANALGALIAVGLLRFVRQRQ